ncbi:MAG: hypothetical protein IJ522_04150 [Acidaminococcaceae bacterium]|nr:hypothetical protein [Acidaminococcaceae bacterium]
MLWVCRTGKAALYFDFFLKNKKIYIPWNGFNYNFIECKTLVDFKPFVSKELDTVNRTTISNTAIQLHYFCNEMRIGDYVLIPNKNSRQFVLCKLITNYRYSKNDFLPHSRSVKIILNNIPRLIFSQSDQYTLRTFRTIFKIKQEQNVLHTINNFIKLKDGKNSNG